MESVPLCRGVGREMENVGLSMSLQLLRYFNSTFFIVDGCESIYKLPGRVEFDCL